MEKIASFQIDHLRLLTGLYVSRVDGAPGARVTTFDLRMTAPNREEVMSTGAVHAIEHLGATYLRNDPAWKDSVLYFGPMGCRTGFYLLMAGELSCLASCAACSISSSPSRATSPAPAPAIAAIIRTWTLRRQSASPASTAPRSSTIPTRRA